MSTLAANVIDPDHLRRLMPKAALSFRGYNQTNLGRSSELALHPKYRDIVEDYLHRASQVCSEATGKSVDLLQRVRQNRETNLDSYAEAVAIIVSMELAQLKILETCFHIDYRTAMLSFGFSLGEVAAVVAGGILEIEGALRVPLSLAQDCIDLTHGVTLGVLFSREQKISFDDVQRLCLEINAQGDGVIGVSAILAPNSMLVLGQGTTLDRFRELLNARFSKRLVLRLNQGDWPPLHTCIMWQRNIPNRSAVMMQHTPFHLIEPKPPIVSLVTGKPSYQPLNALDLMHQWVDHPQRLWDAIYESFVMGVETYIHVGPEPNIVPATLKRLRDNVEAQTRSSLGVRALSVAAQRRWLQSMLPQRTALLRAATVGQIYLEDWLLSQTEF